MKYKHKQEYYLDHKYCAKCKSKNLFKTDLCYIFHKDRIFEDKNSARCLDCKWHGIVDDLVGDDIELSEDEKIREKYNKDHEVCPSCKKKDNLVQTLAAMPYIPECRETWKDTNSCACSCGWRGIVDDLIKE